MFDPTIKEAEYCKEIGLYIIEAYKDPDIDPDQMLGNILASLRRAQVMDPDRVQHFYKEACKKLEGV